MAKEQMTDEEIANAAIDVLTDLMHNSSDPWIRLRAIEEILVRGK